MILNYIIVGQILGFVFLIIGLTILFNRRNVALVIEKLTEDSPSIWLSGFLSLLFGSTLLALSNFTTGISSLIAIIGILSFIKGIILLWAPNLAAKLARKLIHRKLPFFIDGIVIIAIGIIFIIGSF